MVRRALALTLVSLLALPAATVGARPLTSTGSSTDLVVLFQPSTPAASRARLHALAGATVVGRIDAVGLELIRLPRAAVSIYETHEAVVAAEPNRSMGLFAARTNDPLVKLQWGLKAVGAFDAWQLDRAKDEVTVAVIDTGVDANHIDLSGRVLPGFDYLSLDETAQDDHGHGTHIAGVIAANTSNNKGIAGLADGVSVLPMKVCAAEGSCDVFAIYEGIVDAVRRGASVLNLSLGGAGDCSTVDQALFDWVFDQGVVTVAAAGNAAKPDNPTISPANCNHTIGVGAVDERLHKAEFSSFGEFVDIAAPGVDIWSTLPPLVSISSPYIGYGSWQGTSMAAPYVAAAAAMLKGAHPGWGPAEIEERLLSAARDLGKPGRDDRFGEGLLDIARAMR